MVIPAGRLTIDSSGIAALHGISLTAAGHRRPWAMPGHPPPLTSESLRIVRSPLWDEQQAVAFVEGRPVPALPAEPDGGDLLDVVEDAEDPHAQGEVFPILRELVKNIAVNDPDSSTTAIVREIDRLHRGGTRRLRPPRR